MRMLCCSACVERWPVPVYLPVRFELRRTLTCTSPVPFTPTRCSCDIIAQGVIAAAKKIGLKKPVVLRLQGTNVKEAMEFIEVSPRDAISACM